MARRNITYRDFSGGLNTTDNELSVNQSTKKTESPYMVNVEYFGSSSIKTMDGNLQIGDTQSSSIVSGYEYFDGSKKYQVITLANGEVRILNTSTNEYDLIYTFPTTSNSCSFVNMNFGLIMSNGKDDLVYYKRSRSKVLTGTISMVSGTDTITGVSTLFETEVQVGDILYSKNDSDEDVTFIVEDITSDTSLRISENISSTITSKPFGLTDVSLCNATLFNTDDISISEPIRGLAIQVYNGRLWVGGNDGVLYHSELGKYNGWDIKYNAGGTRDFYNDSSAYTGLGLYNDYLVVHRLYTTYLLTQDNDGTVNISPITNNSCQSQHGFVYTNNLYLIFSQRNMGIYPITRTLYSNDSVVAGNEISTKIRDDFLLLKLNELEKIFAVSHPRRRYAMFYMPLYNKQGISTCYVFDFATKAWLLRELPQDVTCAFEFDKEVYIGTSDGKVLREFYTSTFNGENIKSIWRSPWLNFGDENIKKSLKQIQIQLSDSGSSDFYINIRRDNESKYTSRHITEDVSDIDALIWDVGDEDFSLTETLWSNDDGTIGNNWLTSGTKLKRFPMENNYFYKIQLEITTENTNGLIYLNNIQFDKIELEETPW